MNNKYIWFHYSKNTKKLISEKWLIKIKLIYKRKNFFKGMDRWGRHLLKGLNDWNRDQYKWIYSKSVLINYVLDEMYRSLSNSKSNRWYWRIQKIRMLFSTKL